MGLAVERQVPISINFRGVVFDEGFRADIFVEQKVIVELKSVERLQPVNSKQLLTYLSAFNRMPARLVDQLWGKPDERWI